LQSHGSLRAPDGSRKHYRGHTHNPCTAALARIVTHTILPFLTIHAAEAFTLLNGLRSQMIFPSTQERDKDQES
jgi:hypothetical protein